MDFYLLRCNQTGDDVSLQDVECGNVDEHSWSGVIMKSSCISHGHQSTNDCQTVERLNMTLQKELPVFDSAQNITYRSIGCVRCNDESKFSYWGLGISCEHSNGTISTPVNIMAVKRFLKENPDCSWRYTPVQNGTQLYRSCVLHDTKCVSNQLPTMSMLKELCHSYSMVFSVVVQRKVLTYRNPHCALCNPERLRPWSPKTASLTIHLDASSNIVPPEERKSFHKKLIPAPDTHNLTSRMFNCTSIMKNCTVNIGGQQHQVGRTDKDLNRSSTILVLITLVGTSLSIISRCFLLGIYLSFKELRNLPGKCLINLSLALLCYQSIFLGAAKATKVHLLCKVVAIFLHFFVLAAFSWMSVMAFDTGNTFTVKGKITTSLKSTFPEKPDIWRQVLKK